MTHQFQFHKGTIKTLGDSNNEVSRQNFNSIKVRLKHVLNQSKKLEIEKFQFHKGTIKTVKRVVLSPTSSISIP